MTNDATTVLQQALALPERDRAGIAAELLASLPHGDALDVDSDAWVQDIEGRAHGVLSGQTVTKDWDSVANRILGKLSEE